MNHTMYTCGDLQLDLDGRVAYVSGERMLLTFGEFEILRKLMADPGHAFTRRQLHVGARTASERTVDVHILRLRKKLRAARAFRIETVPSIGYRGWASGDAGGGARSSELSVVR